MPRKFTFKPPPIKPQEDGAPPKNKRWQVFGVIAAAAVATIFYVNNAIKVNELLRNRDNFQRSLDSMHSVTRGLQTQVIRLQSAERIDSIAHFSLRMIRNSNAPKTLIIPAK